MLWTTFHNSIHKKADLRVLHEWHGCGTCNHSIKAPRMKTFEISTGNSPFIAAAIHDGHHIREEVREHLNLHPHERMREEDPYTDYLAEVTETRVIGRTSRFEVDLNRPREKAVYSGPAEAWGLQVWKKVLPVDIIARSLAKYDEFYQAVEELLLAAITRFGYFVVLDLHSYNHRRNEGELSPVALNPEINIGTSFLADRWHNAKDAFMTRLQQVEVMGHNLDVRENINFKGGEFSRWINGNFGSHGFSLAIEFRKSFMDEWTGRVDIHHLNNLRSALVKSMSAIHGAIQRIAS